MKIIIAQDRFGDIFVVDDEKYLPEEVVRMKEMSFHPRGSKRGIYVLLRGNKMTIEGEFLASFGIASPGEEYDPY